MREAKKYASGGPLDETSLGQVENHIPHPSGMLNSWIPGRTDKLPISVQAGSYVVPADVVSALGEGNSMSGDKMMRHVLHQAQAQGLIAPDWGTQMQHVPGVPIIVAGGEFVIPPQAAAAIGGGDLERGHNLLDDFVKKVRKNNIKTLRGLRPPKVD